MAQVPQNASSSWLDSIFGDDSFLGDGFDKLSSFGERITALILQSKEQQQQPVQTPTPLQSLFGDTTTTPSQMVLYAGSAVLLGVAIYFVVKKL